MAGDGIKESVNDRPPAEVQEPCQKCGKLGGKSVTFTYDGIFRGSWICPHCIDAANKERERLSLSDTHDQALRVLLKLAQEINCEYEVRLEAALELLRWGYSGHDGTLQRRTDCQ